MEVRGRLIAGNWKMHKTIGESVDFVRALLAMDDCFSPEIRAVIAPPFTALRAVADALGDQTRIAVCGQNMHWAEQGPYTGEISPKMLLDAGARFVIVGHSERRASCGETDATVNLKVKAALAHSLTPIVAVGESFEEHKAAKAKETVMSQTRAALEGLAADAMAKCVLAYEPIWAIGTGLAEDPASADAVMGAIRSCFPALARVPILYGGSVKPANASSLFAMPNIDGALVGGASLDPKSFAEILVHARTGVGAR